MVNVSGGLGIRRDVKVATRYALGVLCLVLATLVSMQGTAGARTPEIGPSSQPGYWLMTGWGTSYAFNAPYMGSPESYGSDQCVNSGANPDPLYACHGPAAAPGGTGYWIGAGSTGLVGCSGSPVCSGEFGDVSAFGVSVPSGTGPSIIYGLGAPVVSVAAAPIGAWPVASDGGVFAMAGAQFYGSIGGSHLNAPVVGMAGTHDGKGYWEVASDGGAFAFGDAVFYGSMGGQHLNAPIVGIAVTGDGKGYWEVASDGGVFAFGDAVFYGSMGNRPLVKPMVGMAANPSGTGYWLVASDGGVFAFGGTPFLGSAVGQVLDAPIVGIAPLPAGARPTPNPQPPF